MAHRGRLTTWGASRIFVLRPFWEMSDDEWQDVLDVNLTGIWRIAKALAPTLMKQRSGSIVVISSVNGVEPGNETASYVAAKHRVLGLMKNLALELAPFGVRCNAICPGVMDTPMIDNPWMRDRVAGHEIGTRDELVDGVYHSHALRGRSVLPPGAVANAALYLNSALAARHGRGAAGGRRPPDPEWVQPRPRTGRRTMFDSRAVTISAFTASVTTDALGAWRCGSGNKAHKRLSEGATSEHADERSWSIL
jgi:hypothetical protein